MRFHNPLALHLLWLLIPMAVALRFLLRRRRALLELLGERQAEQVRRTQRRHRLRVILILLAFAFGALALARPQWGEVKQTILTRGVDCIIAVDVSLSMLADDEKPNRLDKARRLAADLIAKLEGNRIGLVAFAGSSVTLVPLTLDVSALRIFLDSLDTDLIDEPGSSLRRVISRAIEAFRSVGKDRRVLILLTDGEDQESQPIEAAREAASSGVNILAVGIGSSEGSYIPLESLGAVRLKKDAEGRPVVTRVNDALLKEICEITGGRYWRATALGTEVDEIGDFISRLEKGEIGSRSVAQRQERYQIPLAIAILLLLLDSIISIRWR